MSLSWTVGIACYGQASESLLRHLYFWGVAFFVAAKSVIGIKVSAS